MSNALIRPIAALALLAAAPASAQNIVLQDTYEAGPPTVAGAARITGPATFETSPAIGCVTEYAVPDGSAIDYLSDHAIWPNRINFMGGGVTQSSLRATVGTVPGGTYTVSFTAGGVYASAGTPSVDHSLRASAVDAAGTLLGTSAEVTVANNAPQSTGSFTFVATSAETTLLIDGTLCGNYANCNANADISLTSLTIESDEAPVPCGSADDDADGIGNDIDNCPSVANADQQDSDLDGNGDACDLCIGNDASGNNDGDSHCNNTDAFPDDQDETADSDGDGVGDSADPCSGFPNVDQDGDSVCDSDDTCPTDPDDLDADGDQICDVVDVCVGQSNVDSDGDQICDDVDLCIGNDTSGDADGDGYCDLSDNCPLDANAGQEDADGDSVGDACEADTDVDGIIDDEDNCPEQSNADQSDLDNDGQGDVCDDDDDNDGVNDPDDNCPMYANADQADFDGDGSGDACDGDDDADGIEDADDRCAGTPIGALFDEDGCSGVQRVELMCGVPSDYGWRRGHYVVCVVRHSRSAWRSGLVTRRERARMIRRATHRVWTHYVRRIRRRC